MICGWYSPCGKKAENIDGFADAYEKYIFRDSETLIINGRKIVKNNNLRTVDNVINSIRDCGIILKDDLKRIIEWKTGNKFYSGTYKLNTYYHGKTDLGLFFNEIIAHIDELSNKDARTIFMELHRLKRETNAVGIGSVYIITLLYFLKKGEWPIYDRYAHIASLALINGVELSSRVKYLPLDKYLPWAWDDYLEYCQLLQDIFGKQNISRKEDIALWVYGHCFNVKNNSQTFISYF